MNLAFGHDEEQFCLSCLAKKYELDLREFFETGLHYVKSRECFEKAWLKQTDPESCPCKFSCVYDLCFKKT